MIHSDANGAKSSSWRTEGKLGNMFWSKETRPDEPREGNRMQRHLGSVKLRQDFFLVRQSLQPVLKIWNRSKRCLKTGPVQKTTVHIRTNPTALLERSVKRAPAFLLSAKLCTFRLSAHLQQYVALIITIVAVIVPWVCHRMILSFFCELRLDSFVPRIHLLLSRAISEKITKSSVCNSVLFSVHTGTSNVAEDRATKCQKQDSDILTRLCQFWCLVTWSLCQLKARLQQCQSIRTWWWKNWNTENVAVAHVWRTKHGVYWQKEKADARDDPMQVQQQRLSLCNWQKAFLLAAGGLLANIRIVLPSVAWVIALECLLWQFGTRTLREVLCQEELRAEGSDAMFHLFTSLPGCIFWLCVGWWLLGWLLLFLLFWCHLGFF